MLQLLVEGPGTFETGKESPHYRSQREAIRVRATTLILVSGLLVGSEVAFACADVNVLLVGGDDIDAAETAVGTEVGGLVGE